MSPEEYIENRLQHQIDWYDSRSLSNQRTFKRLRAGEIVAAALIPFLSGILVAIVDEWWRLVGAIVIGFLGLVVTIIAGTLSLGRYQENWVEYRTTCDSLKKEKFLYETGVEPYSGEDSFQLLVQRIEALVSQENTTWAQHLMSPELGESYRMLERGQTRSRI